MGFKEIFVFITIMAIILMIIIYNVLYFYKKIIKLRNRALEVLELIKLNKHKFRNIKVKKLKSVGLKDLFNKIKRLISGNTYITNNKNMLILLIVATIFMMFLGPINWPKNMLWFNLIYSVLIIVSLYAYLDFFINFIFSERMGALRILMIVVFIMLLLIMFIGNIKSALEGSYNILTIVIMFVLNFRVTINFITKFIKNSNSKLLTTIIGIFSIIGMECYLIFMYGIYNVRNMNNLILRQESDVSEILSYFYYGCYYAFNLQQPAQEAAFFPLFEYLSITFYNILIIGFFMAYFYDLAKEKKKYKKNKKSEINLIKFE
ncbi:hypothetical protein NBE98_09525 [Clostridium swellfunianum]|uniref:hypothetical protein n=1 Tax=Clostridium swellfunianum TaxID=1367462 RepID=UPI0020301CCE|nr:hypothetical protein [Clostridium swellfunianum]MCM0648612.1 hypothetical protein [Clostridium swellfunianum]